MSDYASEFSIRRLWIILGAGMAIMFGTLLWFGVQIYHAKPPMPAAVRTASGQILYTGEEIQHGQSVWQSTGGMQQVRALFVRGERSIIVPAPVPVPVA